MEKPTPLTSRRNFLKNIGLSTGLIASGSNLFAGPSIIPDLYKKGSLINGVQIGVITYSFREMPDQSLEAVLQYILDSGITATELMGDPAEVFAGKPKNPVDFRAMFPLMRKKRDNLILTEEESKKLSEMEALRNDYRVEVKQWRSTVNTGSFEKVGKMFKKAGVKIYGFKPDAFGKDNSDDEVIFGMKAAKAMGASHITLEHPSDDNQTLRLGKLAEKYGIKVGYHGHEQQTPTFWDTAISQSPANALNLDFGHYVAAGNPMPIEFVKKMNQNIVSMHIKDRQTPLNGKGNLPWGMGDTPLKDLLKQMQIGKYKFPATIELEYKIPEGSNAVTEVKKCLEFCKKTLA
jgi:sugar phosphate isomerase/epimerase